MSKEKNAMQWLPFKLFSKIVAAVLLYIFMRINFFHDKDLIFQENNKKCYQRRHDVLLLWTKQKALLLWIGTLIKKSLVGRAPACNVTTVQPGSRGDAKNISNLLESFQLLISEDMINEILTNTNNSILDFCERFGDNLAGND